MKRFTIILVLLLVMFTVSACTVVNNPNYPLYVGEVKAGVCMIGSDGDSRVFGDVYMINKGVDSITIKEVSLVNPKYLSVIEASLLEIDPSDTTLVGFVNWPLEEIPIHWDKRMLVEGAVINPGDERNLVVAVTSHTDEMASAEAIKIVYTDSKGKQYTQQTFTRYLISSVNCTELEGSIDSYFSD